MKIFTYLCALLLLLFGVSFSLLNASSVSVNYFLGTAALPVSFLIIISVAVGALLSLLFCFVKMLHQKSISRELKKKIAVLEEELRKLTTIPRE